jgi:pheromone shutdown protein TraB
MITLLGVGHVFDLGRSIRAEIHRRRPRVVALELDHPRFAALAARAQGAGRPSLFSVLGRFQSRIASQYGVQVGDEMLAAARAAQEVGSEIALIDRDSRATLLRAWHLMPFRERVRLLSSVLGSFFIPRAKVEEELARYEADERAVMEEFAAELPTVKRVLIDERDEHMATVLRDLHRAKGDVVAVVGDGHIDGLQGRLEGESVDVVRLKELRAQVDSPGASATVSYQL